jgi:hypothetical protein
VPRGLLCVLFEAQIDNSVKFPSIPLLAIRYIRGSLGDYRRASWFFDKESATPCISRPLGIAMGGLGTALASPTPQIVIAPPQECDFDGGFHRAMDFMIHARPFIATWTTFRAMSGPRHLGFSRGLRSHGCHCRGRQTVMSLFHTTLDRRCFTNFPFNTISSIVTSYYLEIRLSSGRMLKTSEAQVARPSLRRRST